MLAQVKFFPLCCYLILGMDVTGQYPAAIAEDINPNDNPDYYVLTVFAIDRDGTYPNNAVRWKVQAEMKIRMNNLYILFIGIGNPNSSITLIIFHLPLALFFCRLHIKTQPPVMMCALTMTSLKSTKKPVSTQVCESSTDL